jgi:hypothetical protein
MMAGRGPPPTAQPERPKFPDIPQEEAETYHVNRYTGDDQEHLRYFEGLHIENKASKGITFKVRKIDASKTSDSYIDIEVLAVTEN